MRALWWIAFLHYTHWGGGGMSQTTSGPHREIIPASGHIYLMVFVSPKPLL